MKILNLNDLITSLRPKLMEYLAIKIGPEALEKKFRCFVHKDSTPSMAYNPKTENTVVHCFSCNASLDIFSAAAHLEGLPISGSDWVTETVPHLAKMFGFAVAVGELTPTDKERAKLSKLMYDVTLVLSKYNPFTEHYFQTRGWSDEHCTAGTISTEDFVEEMTNLGWSSLDLITNFMINTNESLISEDAISMIIKDYNSKPIALVTRNTNPDKPKYCNSRDSVLFQKGEVLFGLDVAIKTAKKKGLYIVEGPGDVLACHRLGIYNVAGTCGTALTNRHLNLLKTLGVKKLFLCLDWDEAGINATKRILRDELKVTPGLNCFVVEPPIDPKTKEHVTSFKDLSDFLSSTNSIEAFETLQRVSSFSWFVKHADTTLSPEELCQNILPIIASEPTAIKRDRLIAELSTLTSVSEFSIREDVAAIRDSKSKKVNERLESSAQSYIDAVTHNPSAALTLLARHESEVGAILKEAATLPVGPAYQIDKYETYQNAVLNKEDGTLGFRFSWFKNFQEAIDRDSLPWNAGSLFYFGGRPNAGKTALLLALATDVAYSDPDAKVIFHFTDDSFRLVIPRLISNLATVHYQTPFHAVTPQAVSNPMYVLGNNQDAWGAYEEVNGIFKRLLTEEKIIILDHEEGPNLSILERQLKHVRHNDSKASILAVMDNTHNYQDFLDSDSGGRITQIADQQKHLAGKYDSSVFATAEYRKSGNASTEKSKSILWPSDDDFADSRAPAYRATHLIHTVQDLHDRKENAEVYHLDSAGRKQPRILVNVSKNKLGSFKDKLAFDMHKTTVSLQPISIDRAFRDYESNRTENKFEEDV